MKPFSHLGFFCGAKFPNSILKNKELEKELLLGQHKAYLATTQHGPFKFMLVKIFSDIGSNNEI